MPPPDAAIPPTPRRTLLEWIDLDDEPTISTRPACSTDLELLHARLLAAPGGTREPLALPPGLHLAPLG